MRNRENLQTTLAELKLQFNSPLTLQIMINDFDDYIKSNFGGCEGVFNGDGLKAYFIGLTEKFFKNLCLEDISAETNRLESLMKNTRQEKYIKFGVFENGNFEEANKFLSSIYAKWNIVMLLKEECSDHITLIKKALVYLNSLKKIMTAFIQDSSIHKVKFSSVADSKRFIEVIVVSVDSYTEILKAQISEISAWIDNCLASKVNMLMKSESSLRLLSEYAGWDYSSKSGNGVEPSGFKGCGNHKI